jgi:hypothetical protein
MTKMQLMLRYSLSFTDFLADLVKKGLAGKLPPAAPKASS